MRGDEATVVEVRDERTWTTCYRYIVIVPYSGLSI